MNKLPISAVVLTYNEEKNIDACLKSIYAWTDEIFVVDSYSTDRTLDIAKKYTDNIVQHPFDNYSAQRNWAQDNLPLRNEWVLHLDADERSTPELVEELESSLLTLPEQVDGFLVPRRTVFMGKWIKHGSHYPVYNLRIFKKDSGRCEDRLYDQHFYVKGNVRLFKSDIINIVTSDFKNWISRHKKWASQEALDVMKRLQNGKKNNGHVIKGEKEGTPLEQRRKWKEKYYRMPILIRPFLYFIYRYFIKGGFLDGRQGLKFHFLQGFWYRMLVDVTIYEIKKKARTENKDVKDVIYELYGVTLNK